jgi:hypothetical protein
MTEVFDHPEHVELWEAAVRGEPADWEEIFRGYRATVDWPGAAFYEELMERYPGAKVILTVRHPERWYESTLNTIYHTRKIASSPPFTVIGLFVPGVRHMKRATGIVNDLAWEETFRGRFEDREHAIQVFDRLNEEVVEHVPAERLLVYEVKEGWEPLCEFLGRGGAKGRAVPAPQRHRCLPQEGPKTPGVRLRRADHYRRASRAGPARLPQPPTSVTVSKNSRGSTMPTVDTP